MAAGVFHGRFTLTGAAQTLDTLTGGIQTYNVIVLKRVSGPVVIGNSGVTTPTGYPLKLDQETILNGAIVGANLNLIGNGGVVEFFGNATA